MVSCYNSPNGQDKARSFHLENGDDPSPTDLAGLLNNSNEKIGLLRDKSPKYHEITSLKHGSNLGISGSICAGKIRPMVFL